MLILKIPAAYLRAVAGALASDERNLAFTSNRGENTVGIFTPGEEAGLDQGAFPTAGRPVQQPHREGAVGVLAVGRRCCGTCRLGASVLSQKFAAS